MIRIIYIFYVYRNAVKLNRACHRCHPVLKTLSRKPKYQIYIYVYNQNKDDGIGVVESTGQRKRIQASVYAIHIQNNTVVSWYFSQKQISLSLHVQRERIASEAFRHKNKFFSLYVHSFRERDYGCFLIGSFLFVFILSLADEEVLLFISIFVFGNFRSGNVLSEVWGKKNSFCL